MSEITKTENRKQWLRACNGFVLLWETKLLPPLWSHLCLPRVQSTRRETKEWNTNGSGIRGGQNFSWRSNPVKMYFVETWEVSVLRWYPARDVPHPYNVLTDSFKHRPKDAASTEHISLMADGTKNIVLPWEPPVVIYSPLSFRIASVFSLF